MHITDLEGGGRENDKKEKEKTGRPHKGSNRVIHTHTGFLEEHVLPFVRKWSDGCCFLGERGAESIHAYFNKLNRTYCSIPVMVQRLRQEMVEHHLHVSPKNVADQPKPLKCRHITL